MVEKPVLQAIESSPLFIQPQPDSIAFPESVFKGN